MKLSDLKGESGRWWEKPPTGPTPWALFRADGSVPWRIKNGKTLYLGTQLK